MSEDITFTNEDLNDPKSFIKKFTKLMVEISKGANKEVKGELSGFFRANRSKAKEQSEENINSPRRVKMLNPITYMVKNGVELYIELNDKFKLIDVDASMDDLYKHYVETENVEVTEKTLPNVNYLIQHFAERDEFEKCVALQNLLETINTLDK